MILVGIGCFVAGIIAAATMENGGVALGCFFVFLGIVIFLVQWVTPKNERVVNIPSTAIGLGDMIELGFYTFLSILRNDGD